MELLQLRYFHECAKTENFARVAEKYMVPSSSISASIKRLEEELGCKLFERRSNRIYLNENGKLLQNSLGAIFDELDQTVAKVKSHTPLKTEIRILILALQPYISSLLFEYQKAHPNVQFVSMFDVNRDASLDYDVIIDKENDTYTEYKSRELGSYPLCFMAVRTHPLVGKTLTMRDLRNESFITLESELGKNSILFDCCKNAGFYPNIVLQTNDRQCFQEGSEAGIGLGLWLKCDQDPAPKDLVDLDVKDLQLRSSVYLYYKPDCTNAQIRDFAEFILSKHF